VTRISRLGYLDFEVSDPGAWKTFAIDCLGLALAAENADGSIALRMDGQARRILLRPGERDDLTCVGFEVADRDSLRALASRLEADGVSVVEASAEDATQRGVGHLYRLEDPSGVPIELFSGPRSGAPFVSRLVPSGFCTGDEGLGHILVVVRDADRTRHFYCDLLGMRVSDYIEPAAAPGRKLQITFVHANARHHTLAFFEGPARKRINHFMIEMNAMNDVGLAFDRCVDAGVPIASTLGQHPNDQMLSFYARTPSGFAVEVGWGGRKVDDATWQVRTYDRTSTWGHRSVAEPR
jgi:2,3-dihydroxybiphenyl 1,2-dioxygenase